MSLDTPVSAQALLRLVWAGSIPAWVQGQDDRLLEVNDALLGMLGMSREQLVGLHPAELEPAEDRAASRLQWQDQLATASLGQAMPPNRCRLLDAQGCEHWMVVSRENIAPPGQPPRWLALLQDLSPEMDARGQLARAQAEIGMWFELSRTGMLVYDHTGLLVRCNAAFEAMVDRVPEVLDEAAPELQALLGWQAPQGGEADRQGRVHPQLQAGAAPLECRASVRAADGRRRQLGARLLAYAPQGAPLRVMAVLEDLSAEEERDLARLEMGMLMDTASVGVATYDPARGWLATQAAAPAAAAPGAAPAPQRGGGALLGIVRELVEPDSLPEYERLQRALRQGERTEVRYAVRHPELGPRWLLTRVEPGALGGGRRTTSVVTLDITEQERAQQRNNQLLRELATILDGSTAGIAYLRGPVLARCNQRFERMLGFEPGAAAGATLDEIFSGGQALPPVVQQAAQALAEGRPFEAELPIRLEGREGPRQLWYSLSVRRAEGVDSGPQAEAVAVLTDITRLKSQQSELEQLLRDRELMFSLSEVGIVYLRGARIERANQAMAAMTGWAPPELTRLDTAELYESARDCVDFEARVEQSLRERGRFSGERRLRRRDGSLLWVQVAVRPVDNENLEAGLICSFVDVDERRRVREALSLQAERTRAVLNSVLVGIVTVGEHGIEWLNRSARRMFAGELADFVGEPISTVATPEPDHPLRSGQHLQRLQEGQAETFECRLRGRDGREFWVVGNAVLTGSEASGGSRGQVTYALLDIERRRQAEVSIAQAQASLQRVIETAPLAIALFDARSLRVLQVNQTASNFFGCGLQEMMAQGLDACPDPAKVQALRGWLAQGARDGERAQYEWVDRAVPPALPGAGEGAPRVWDLRVAPLEASGGVAAQLLLVASDVTEQRLAEQARLQAAIDQRELLVREVHHRIKNNLQGVAGLLQQNAQRHPELATLLAEAVGQVRAIAQVYGLQVGMTGPLGLAELLRAIARSVELTFGKRIAVGPAEEPHQLPEAEAIPLALVLNELLTNAVKHGQGGIVNCSLQVQGPAVVVRIAGPGQLGPNFNASAVPGSVSGLGLVRALLPRRSAALRIEQQGDEVVAEVELRPPSVRLPEAASVGTPPDS